MRTTTTAARRIAAAAGAVTLATSMAVPPAGAVTVAERQRGLRTGVYVEGDSLTVGSGPIIRRTLRRHVRSIETDAQVGRFTGPGLAGLARDPQARRSRIWVIALGTNDGPDPQRMQGFVMRSLRLAGPRREVIWLTLRRPGDYGRVNRMLRRSDRRSDRLHVIDWAGITARNPGLLAADGVHATAHGYRVRARLIARTALYLARQP